MRILFSCMLLLVVSQTLQCSEQIRTLNTSITSIFDQVKKKTDPQAQDKNRKDSEKEIENKLKKIEENAPIISDVENWCNNTKGSNFHPVVKTVFSPFSLDISDVKNYYTQNDITEWATQYAEQAINYAIQIIDIIKESNSQILNVKECIAEDIINKLQNKNTFNMFREIQEKDTVYNKLEQLVQKIPNDIWYYPTQTDSKTFQTPIDTCIREVAREISHIYLIKAIIQTTPEETLNQQKHFHYAAHLSKKTLKKKNLDYLKITAQTIDILLQKQPKLKDKNNIKNWPIFEIAYGLKEIKENLTQSMRDSIDAILDVLHKYGGDTWFTTKDPEEEDNGTPIDISETINEYYQNKDKQHESKTDVSNELNDIYRHIQHLADQMQALR